MKMNKLCGVTALLALLFALVLPADAFAQDAPAQSATTTLTVEVPAQSVRISLELKGVEVLYNGVVCTGSLLVPRDSTPTLQLRPDTGYSVTRVMLDGKEITDQLKDNYLTLPPVTGDITLTVETTANRGGGGSDGDGGSSGSSGGDGSSSSSSSATGSTGGTTGGTAPGSTLPQTGDAANPTLWVWMLAASALGLAALAKTRRRNR